MDIHGGKAVMLGKTNYLSNLYQVIPIAITVEGANILTRSMIIFGQGLMRCHPFLKDELESLERKDYSLFNNILGSHLAHQASVKVKSLVFALSCGLLAKAPENVRGVNKPYYRQLASVSASYAFLVEMVLMKYGPGIKFQESMNGLFADLLIKMYGISTLLKYSEKLDSNVDNLIQWTVEQRIHQSQILLKEICDQFKFSIFFKWIVLPWGINQTKPTISLQNKVINLLINNQQLKDSLTKDVLFIQDSPLDELEQAYKLAIEAEKVYKRVKYVDTLDAIDALLDQQQINQQEHQLLLNLTELRQKVLAVDDYED